MTNILKSFSIIVAIAAVAGGATYSYFSDTELVAGNTIAAGELDLSINGTGAYNNGVLTFNVTGAKPGSQIQAQWAINNDGNINGFVDLENITQNHAGGELTDAEGDAGDAGNAGSLGSLLDIFLFVDADGDGWFGAGDTTIYNGALSGLASGYDTNVPLAAGATTHIQSIINWQSHPGTQDNIGQGDTLSLDIAFELGQTIGQ